VFAIAENLETTNGQRFAGFAGLAERLRNVSVEVRGRRYGGGSGIIWRDDGLIVTNSHVVPGNSAEVRLADRRVFNATVVKRDRWRDLVELRAEVANLPSAAIGDSGNLRVGELVVAIGNPLGQVGALATGIVHATRRRLIEADLRLAPGNSGGLLANASGEVIGVNCMIARGLALAVPAREVERFLVRRKDEPDHQTLGVMLRPVRVKLDEGPSLGLLVIEVQGGSLAERAGIMIGDVLVSALGQPFRAFDDLPRALFEAREIELGLVRGGKRLSITVVLGDDVEETEQRS
jgi:serine protease Do